MMRLISAILLIVNSLLLIYWGQNAIFESVIVEKGYGLYCPDTGDFAFIGECSNE